MGNNQHLPTERFKRNLTDEEKEDFGKLSPLQFLQQYGKLPSDHEDGPRTDHLPDEKTPGLRSMDVKGKANDNAGDGNEPTSHVSQAARIDSEKRKTVSQQVNPPYDVPTAEELRDDPDDHQTKQVNDDSDDEEEETDEEMAKRCRERYGHLDSYDETPNT